MPSVQFTDGTEAGIPLERPTFILRDGVPQYLVSAGHPSGLSYSDAKYNPDNLDSFEFCQRYDAFCGAVLIVPLQQGKSCKCSKQSSTTPAPSTQRPSTQQPTTQEPTTRQPTTQEPTTQQTTTQEPQTENDLSESEDVSQSRDETGSDASESQSEDFWEIESSASRENSSWNDSESDDLHVTRFLI